MAKDHHIRVIAHNPEDQEKAEFCERVLNELIEYMESDGSRVTEIRPALCQPGEGEA